MGSVKLQASAAADSEYNGGRGQEKRMQGNQRKN